MQLGVELIALAPLALKVPTHFELLFSAGCEVIPESFGKDEYAYPVLLAPQARVAATGRKCLFLNHQKKALGGYQAGPAELVEVAWPGPGAHLLLFLNSTLPLTRNRLAREFVLNLVTPAGARILPLREDSIEHSGNGKFVVNLSALLSGAQASLPA